jgi:hypothetical protein
LCSESEGGTNISSITQTNVSWSKLAESTASSSPHCEIWVGIVSGSADTGITVTYSDTTYCGFHASEWSGLTGTLDQSGAITGAAQGSFLPVVTPSVCTALVIAAGAESTYGAGFNAYAGLGLLQFAHSYPSGGDSAGYAVAFGFPGLSAPLGHFINSHGGNFSAVVASIT